MLDSKYIVTNLEYLGIDSHTSFINYQSFIREKSIPDFILHNYELIGKASGKMDAKEENR